MIQTKNTFESIPRDPILGVLIKEIDNQNNVSLVELKACTY